MKLNFIRPLGIAAILLLCAVFSSCSDKKVYSNDEKLSLKIGDTIYIDYGGYLLLAVVQKNDKNKKMLILKRQNIYDTKGICDQVEAWPYAMIP